jgi:transposase InsO family protein
VVATVGHSHPAQVDPIDVTLEESPPDLTGKETEPPRPPDTPEATETPTSTDDPGLRTTEGPPPDEEGATATTTAETLPSAPASRTDIVDVTGEAQEKEEKATESNEISSPPPDGGGEPVADPEVTIEESASVEVKPPSFPAAPGEGDEPSSSVDLPSGDPLPEGDVPVEAPVGSEDNADVGDGEMDLGDPTEEILCGPAAALPNQPEPDLSPEFLGIRTEGELPRADPDAVEPTREDFMTQMAIDPELPSEAREQLANLLWKHRAVFLPPRKLGLAALPPHEIHTASARPMSTPPYRVGPAKQEVIDQEVQELLDQGCIQPSMSPWASPVVLVKKPDGKWRFCCDYRRLNQITERDVYPLPRVQDTLHMLGGKKYFTTVDLLSGFWQIPMEENSRQKTAFVTMKGLWEWKVMPMGVCNAPSTFQRAMDTVLASLKWAKCLVYLDDILVYGETFEEHLANLGAVLERLESHRLYIKPKKCTFGSTSTTHLGHVVTGEGLRPLSRHIDAVKEFPRPTTKTKLKSFLGLTSYYRTFVPRYAANTAPLRKLLGKDIPPNVEALWNDACEASFEHIKTALTTAPLLAYPDWTKAFTLRTDASIDGLGAVLMQGGKVIAYLSRSLSPAEAKYDTRELECLAVIYACENLKPYLQNNRSFVVQTDHRNLKWLMSVRHDSGRLARWALRLSEYPFVLEHISGSENEVADALSRAPWHPVCFVGRGHFAHQNHPRITTVTWEPKTIEPIPTREELILAQRRDPFCQELRLRLQDQQEVLDKEALADPEEEDTAMVPPSDEASPVVPAEVSGTGVNSSARFCLENNILVRITPASDTCEERKLIVVPAIFYRTVLYSVHNSALGGHIGRDRTMKKLRQFYWWRHMGRDARKWIKTCQECQQAKATKPDNKGYLVRRAPTDHPFEIISMDLLGPFPISVHGNRWSLTVIDSFTNWCIFIPVPNKESTTIAEALLKHVVLEHGAFSCLLSDREPTLAASAVSSLIRLLKARRIFTSAYHPQSNGQCERIHRFINAALRTYMSKAASIRDWESALKCAEWSYRTTALKGSEYTPYFLLYGRHPVFPESFVTHEPKLHISCHDYLQQIQKEMAQAYDELAIIHEKLRTSQKEDYDKHRQDQSFAVGDLCLMYRTPLECSKLCFSWKGPFEIVAKHSPVSYTLKSVQTGATIDERININRLARFHPRHAAFLEADAQAGGGGCAPMNRHTVGEELPAVGDTNEGAQNFEKENEEGQSSNSPPDNEITESDVMNPGKEKESPIIPFGWDTEPEAPPPGIDEESMKVGEFVIVELKAEDYDHVDVGTHRPGSKAGRQPLVPHARGSERENNWFIWRVARITEVVMPTTMGSQAQIKVHFYETYQHRADITQRAYLPAYRNGRGQEVYTKQYGPGKRKGTPQSWEVIEDVMPREQIVSTSSFVLNPDDTLPKQAVLDLLPLLGVHVISRPP